ncbi:MAG: hypothetical protein LQ339_007037 [Xanthoria mediterranea]|nr:MAG: hypothetical protein LQ339_007037 [Xanthoria mediterranea]
MTTVPGPKMASLPPPPGGDYNRAAEVYTFTWVMLIISIIFVLGRMYSRSKLTKNVWWDDWCICAALLVDLAVSIIWTVYAGKGYARHMYYLNRLQLSHAEELNAISRSLCVVGIGIGKISVAFLIERFAGPSKWRRWLLRSISISIAVSAIITVTLFYVQCQPVRAVWDKSLVKAGKAKCWDPIPVNTWNQVIASYWAFLDFALAIIPVDIIWKLQLSRKKKVGLSLLLSAGIFAGICAAVKTSKIPITVRGQIDITWTTIELLMWGGIEINVIIVAACIPTLRPLVLVLLGRPSGSQYRNGASSRRSYSQHLGPNRFSARHNPPSHTSGIHANKAFDSTTELHSIASDKNKPNAITVNREVRVQSGETTSDDGDNMKRERQWGYERALENGRAQ